MLPYMRHTQTSLNLSEAASMLISPSCITAYKKQAFYCAELPNTEVLQVIEMKKEMNKGHVLLFPFSTQGHINPVLQFAKRLASKGLRTTLVTTVYLSKSMHVKNCKVGFETLSDGYDDTGPYSAPQGASYLDTFREVGSRSLADIIEKYNHGDERITCLVSDAIIPWALDVGKGFGLHTAAFYTQTCSASSIFYHVTKGNLKVPVKGPTVSIPRLPDLALQDLPDCVVVLEGSAEVSLQMLSSQFSNVEKADWLFFNTFFDLESKILKWMGELWRVRAVGPTTPSMYLDKRVESDTENSLHIFTPTESSYIEWLNAREPGSVIYIAFGSLAELGGEQMEELVYGIKQTNKNFIWVVRETEQSKLPEGFVEEMIDKGLVVSWCSQLEVLAHKAIGCFLTHCGWNSTVEALSLGVPMVAMPQMWDQFTNAKLVQDVWGLGVRAKKDDAIGFVTRNELESCIREVMEGGRGETIKMSASRWKELAKNAVDVGGSTDLNIEEFVACIKSN